MNVPFHPPVKSLRDLLHQLGDIPAERVRWNPVPGTATIEDLLLPENEGCELVDGTLVEKPVGEEESFLGMSLGMWVNQFVRTHNLGIVTGEQGNYQLPSGPVRGPDIAFTSWDRLPGRRRSGEAIPVQTPDLVVEVLSPSNTAAEMARKRDEYFRAGVRLLWEINPRTRTVREYTTASQSRDLTAADTLDGRDVLPGFTLPLANLFAELDRHG
jgi:Uma2 family endonuclease